MDERKEQLKVLKKAYRKEKARKLGVRRLEMALCFERYFCRSAPCVEIRAGVGSLVPAIRDHGKTDDTAVCTDLLFVFGRIGHYLFAVRYFLGSKRQTAEKDRSLFELPHNALCFKSGKTTATVK